MSDTEMVANTTPAGETSTTNPWDDMPKGDLDFLMACIKNTVDGNLVVDITGVAADLGYQNHRSASNRLLTIKKKYSLNITASTKKASDAPSTPKTPKNANKVIKSPQKTRAKAVKGDRKVLKKEIAEEAVQEADTDEGMAEAGDSSDVESPKKPAATPKKPVSTKTKATPKAKATPKSRATPKKAAGNISKKVTTMIAEALEEEVEKSEAEGSAGSDLAVKGENETSAEGEVEEK